MRFRKSFLLVIKLFLVTVLFLSQTTVYAAESSSITHTTKNDFTAGSVSDNLDVNVSPGEVRLKRDKNTQEVELDRGYSPADNTLVSLEQVTLNQGFAYNIISSPALSDNYVYHSFLDSNNGYLYVSTYGGLSVIDTNADTLITRYHTGSTPALTDNRVYHSFLDSDSRYLYVGTRGGLSVIDTNIDSLVTRYHTGSTPALANNNVVHSFLDSETGYLYVSTWGGGLSVIDTKKTADPSDDTLVIRYSTSSTPALPTGGSYPNDINHAFLDRSSNLLYISTYSAGLSAIDTKGTVDPGDDVLVKNYRTSSTPALADNNVRHSFLDPNTKHLYVSTWSGGLSVIDTNADTLVTRYHTGSNPVLASNNIFHSFLDSDMGYLYVSTSSGGLSVIDTNTDTLITLYHTGSTPALADNSVYHSFLDTDSGYLYVSTYYGGLSIINTNNHYTSVGQYDSLPYDISQIPKDVLTWESSGNEVSLQYRVGGEDAAWVDDFDDDDTSNISDFFSYGYPFNTLRENDGTLKLSDPVYDGEAYMSIDTGAAADRWPVGSIIRMRFRATTDLYNYLGIDNWEDYREVGYNPGDNWLVQRYIATDTFSYIAFGPYWYGEWSDKDYMEVDWVSITSPDSEWSEWSDVCTNQYGCEIDPADLEGSGWIQFRLNLSTDDPTQTPVVNGVTFASGYQDSGEFVSSVVDAGQVVKWDTLTSESTTPSGTNITFFTRTGNTSIPDGSWSGWQPVNSPISSPNSKYLQYKSVMTTTNENITPILDSVTLNYSSISTSTPTPTPALTLNNIGDVLVKDGVLNYSLLSGKDVVFSGTTIPFSQVRITIYSDPQVCETQADSEGNYSCTFQYIQDGLHRAVIIATTPDGEVLTYPEIILGINVSLASTGVSMWVSPTIGLTLMLAGLFVTRMRCDADIKRVVTFRVLG